MRSPIAFTHFVHPVTEALFVEIPHQLSFSLAPSCTLLESLGCALQRIGPFLRFDYEDQIALRVTLSRANDISIAAIEICASLPSDEHGWNGWSKEREMERLRIQENWLRRRGLSGPNISNLLSPQDGASAIHIAR